MRDPDEPRDFNNYKRYIKENVETLKHRIEQYITTSVKNRSASASRELTEMQEEMKIKQEMEHIQKIVKHIEEDILVRLDNLYRAWKVE